MHAWGAVDPRIYLAKKNHGYSISAQSYDFYLHLAQLDILEFTLAHMNQIKPIFQDLPFYFPQGSPRKPQTLLSLLLRGETHFLVLAETLI